MKDPIKEMTPAYYTLLRTITPSINVYDEMVPEGVTDSQYILMGEKSANDLPDLCGKMTSVQMVVEVVVKGTGTLGKTAREIADKVIGVINRGSTITLPSFQVCTTRLVLRNSLVGDLVNQDKIFRIIIRFEHKVSEY